MSIKYVRFNYFTIQLVPVNGQDVSNPWNMKPLLDYISVMNNPLDTVINVGEYNAELDRHTFVYQVNPEMYSFQITKLRDNDLPPLKTIGIPREELELEENQYLGEYITIVYDPIYHTVGVQSNIYGLNLNQVETFLTELRRRYRQLHNLVDQVDINVELRPIIDPNKIGEIRNANIFRKITIKGSNYAAEALANAGSLDEVSQVIGRIQGLNFELTLSVGNAPQDRSLDQESIQEIIDSFTRMENEQRPNIEVTGKINEDSKTEVVNLIQPKLTNKLRFTIRDRQALGHELIHNTFMEKYTEIRTSIARVIRINNG